MRGNYKDEEAAMKFTPESSISTEEYQVQQYIKQPLDSSPTAIPDIYTIIDTAVDENGRL